MYRKLDIKMYIFINNIRMAERSNRLAFEARGLGFDSCGCRLFSCVRYLGSRYCGGKTWYPQLQLNFSITILSCGITNVCIVFSFALQMRFSNLRKYFLHLYFILSEPSTILQMFPPSKSF